MLNTRDTILNSNGAIKPDDEVYSVWFRASCYILAFAVFLASFLCPSMMRDFRLSSNFFTVAVLVNTFYDSTMGSLVLFEWYLVSWMTVGLSLLNIPLSGTEFDDSIGSLGSSWLIYGGWMIAQPWLYTAGRNIGNPKSQPVYVLFFWKKVNIFSRAWMIFCTIMSMVSLVFGVVTSIGGIILLTGDTFHPQRCPLVKSGFAFIHNRFHGSQSQRFLSCAVPIGMFGMLIVSISIIEGTLWINGLSLCPRPIKSGQLIALIVGICNITMIPYRVLGEHIQRKRQERDLEVGDVQMHPRPEDQPHAIGEPGSDEENAPDKPLGSDDKPGETE